MPGIRADGQNKNKEWDTSFTVALSEGISPSEHTAGIKHNVQVPGDLCLPTEAAVTPEKNLNVLLRLVQIGRVRALRCNHLK